MKFKNLLIFDARSLIIKEFQNNIPIKEIDKNLF